MRVSTDIVDKFGSGEIDYWSEKTMLMELLDKMREDQRENLRWIKSEKTMLLELLDKKEKDFREASIRPSKDWNIPCLKYSYFCSSQQSSHEDYKTTICRP